MKKVLLISVICSISILSCIDPNRDQIIESIERYLQGQADYYRFNGNVLISEKGKIIYQKSFGFSDFNKQLALNDSSVFELASVSKQFTALGILMLEKQGLINLNDSLRKFFPELPYYNIKIHHLLTHTSGLPDYGELFINKWDHKKIAFNDDVIYMLAKEKPGINFKPGEKWEYCNTAYVLLASIIEKVSDLTFKEFMATNISVPLKMTNTRVYNTRRSGEILDNYAYGYIWSDSLKKYFLPDSLPDYDYVYFLDGIQGDGIINSTTGDLLKWSRFLFDQKLGIDSITQKLLYPHILCDSSFAARFERYNGTSSLFYGYGVLLGKNEFGDFAYHTGGWPGYHIEIFHNFKNAITLVVLSNNESNASGIRSALTKIIFNQPLVYPQKHIPITLDTTLLDVFVGTYTYSNYQYEIVRQNDSIFIINPFTGTKSRLLPESDNKLFAPNFDFQFGFNKAEGNQTEYYQVFFGSRFDMLKK